MKGETYVLGLNYRPLSGNDIGHHPAAALLRNGQIVAMCEEERFVRIKEAPGRFPLRAVAYCLSAGNVNPCDLSAVGWNWDPVLASIRSKRQCGLLTRGTASALQFGLRHTPLRRYAPLLANGFLPERIVGDLHSQLLYWFGLNGQMPVFCFDHHLAHAASTFYASGFQRAAVMTWDCWGDHLSGLIARGEGMRLEVLEELPFSRFSVGKLNDVVYEFLRTSEKGNLMGLAPYGTRKGMLDRLVDIDRLSMSMDLLAQKAPFPLELTSRAGAPRRDGDPLEERHRDLAADLQQAIEAFGFELVKRAIALTGERDICFAGGCALNATFNGKVGRSNLVDRMFVQPEAGDAGGALGAAYLAHLRLGQPLSPQELRHAYWGPSFSTDEIVEQAKLAKVPYEIIRESEIPDCVADMLVQQEVVGWFQLGSEWGPRALGARSIIADPRHEDIRDRINAAVKYRDWWRPFAPSMLAESADDYLEDACFAPFMIVTFPVKEAKKKELRGVTHLDGSTRPQMVERAVNPTYYDTIQRFGERTGTPMVLNTSFNLKGEPMVNSPRDALRTFFSSGLDALIMKDVLVRKAAR